MDALRNSGAPSSLETSPEPHDPDRPDTEARRGPSPAPGSPDARLPPARARSTGMEAGPSSGPPSAFMRALLRQAAGPSSPAVGPAQGRIASDTEMRALLGQLRLPSDPGPTDHERIWSLLFQQPELASRFENAYREMRRHANPDAPDNHFDLPVSGNQLVVLSSLFQGLEGLRLLQTTARTRLEQDIGRQQQPLGREIQAWAACTGVRIASSHAFDQEDNAAPFARVLTRMRTESLQAHGDISEETRAQGSLVLQAIAGDPVLRREVFSLAQDALGSCRDNLVEGFSRIVLAVDNHRMVEAVARGDIDAQRLDGWAASLFRLSLLETAVHRYIADKLGSGALSEAERISLTEEPLETMVLAKVELREALGLPHSTASTIRFGSLSTLTPADLDTLKSKVQTEAQNSEAYGSFLLGNPTWCAGMKALYRQEFEDLKNRQDKAPFYELALPTGDDPAAQAAYNEQALRLEAQHAGEERALLLRLAGPTDATPQNEAESSRHDR